MTRTLWECPLCKTLFSALPSDHGACNGRPRTIVFFKGEDQGGPLFSPVSSPEGRPILSSRHSDPAKSIP